MLVQTEKGIYGVRPKRLIEMVKLSKLAAEGDGTLVAAGALGQQERGRGRQVRRRHQHQLLHGVQGRELLEAQTQAPRQPARMRGSSYTTASTA